MSGSPVTAFRHLLCALKIDLKLEDKIRENDDEDVLLDRYFFASLNEILSGFLQLFRRDVNSFQSFFESDFSIQSDSEII